MKNNQTKSWHLHIQGQVQGIGYRPLVYKVAKRMGIKGWVKNGRDGLHVEFNAQENQASQFTKEITKQSVPPNCKITHVNLSNINFCEFNDFTIRQDNTAKEANLLFTPDLALCKACKDDISNNSERRYNYPFTSCSHCGPRFSIIEKLPYDRTNTSMRPFEFCSECHDEYTNPSKRRYYAQTNSCPACSITMQLHDSEQKLLSQNTEEIIDLVLQLWEEGKIIAIKGIGGYLLTCDVRNKETIHSLRERKKRPSKPFALMYTENDVSKEFEVSDEELKLLTNHVSPIVLLSQKTKGNEFSGIAEGLDRIGTMIPYAPIFKVLLEKFKKPIVATSANISNATIVYKDEQALAELSRIADYVLSNNRPIVIPQDDSLITISPKENQKIILRRSRGLAPTFISNITFWSTDTVLCAGAQLKSTFTLLHKGNVYISQYLGDLDHLESLNNYKAVQKHLISLLEAKPTVMVLDNHPGYQSSITGSELARKSNYQSHHVQHHIAHFSAVIGEHNLMDYEEPILGVIWDGLGLGDDGNMWGGEYFVYDDYQFTRTAHLPYYNLILNDKMAKEPRLSALSMCFSMADTSELLRAKFTDQEWNIYTNILGEDTHIKTSSMGRLIDAVASLLNIKDKQTYEGEAAMHLEVLARKYFTINGYKEIAHFNNEDLSYKKFSPTTLLACVLKDIKNNVSKTEIAAKFHGSLVKWIEAIAKKNGCINIAFSGGVFQNSLLVDLIISSLKEQYKLFFHEQLSPNDENISFGQLINYEISKRVAKKT